MRLRNILIMVFTIYSISAWSQVNRVSISGGYPSTTIEERDTKASGWRITGLYEYNKSESKFIHGIGVGYISVSGSTSYTDQIGPNQGKEITVDYEVSSLPIYYAPKILLGKSESFKFYINLMAGVHFSDFRSESNYAITTASDGGFYGGAGAGLMYTIKSKWFINLGYEFSYLSNAYYSDGIMNSFNLGVGIKF